jgi:hypothetical protein
MKNLTYIIIILSLLSLTACGELATDFGLNPHEIEVLYTDFIDQNDYEVMTSIISDNIQDQNEQFVFFKTKQGDSRNEFGLGTFYRNENADDSHSKIIKEVETAKLPNPSQGIGYVHVQGKTSHLIGLYFLTDNNDFVDRQVEVTYTDKTTGDSKSRLYTFKESASHKEIIELNEENDISLNTIEVFDPNGESLYFIDCNAK